MNLLNRASFRLVVFVSLGIVPIAALSAVYPKSDSDFKLLPPYCKVKLSKDVGGASYKTWSARIRGFSHVHHYCAGLHTVNLANREVDPTQRKYLLDSTIPEFEYMETHASDSQLIPEVLTQKGKVLLRLKRESEAIVAFQRAIQIKKDYTPAYMAIADYYISLGNIQNARDILNQGLKWAPRSKGLMRRKENLESK